MVEAILKGKEEDSSLRGLLDGEYGIKGLFVGSE